MIDARAIALSIEAKRCSERAEPGVESRGGRQLELEVDRLVEPEGHRSAIHAEPEAGIELAAERACQIVDAGLPRPADLEQEAAGVGLEDQACLDFPQDRFQQVGRTGG